MTSKAVQFNVPRNQASMVRLKITMAEATGTLHLQLSILLAFLNSVLYKVKMMQSSMGKSFIYEAKTYCTECRGTQLLHQSLILVKSSPGLLRKLGIQASMMALGANCMVLTPNMAQDPHSRCLNPGPLPVEENMQTMRASVKTTQCISKKIKLGKVQRGFLEAPSCVGEMTQPAGMFPHNVETQVGESEGH